MREVRPAIRGRVLWRQGATACVRTQVADIPIDGAGDARPGDLVEIAGDASPRVVRRYRAAEDAPGTECARLPRPRIEGLRARDRAARAVREALGDWGFFEIDAPTRVPSPGLEVHIDAVPAQGGYLVTSPEMQMKRLLAGGLERIFSLGACFRAGEAGDFHNPEFSMLEWYRAWASWDEIAADTEALVAEAARAVAGTTRVFVPPREPAGEEDARPGGDGPEGNKPEGHWIDLAPPWERLPVLSALERYAGVSLRGGESAEEVSRLVRGAGIDPGAAADWDELFYAAFVERVEPALRTRRAPVFLIDWPVELAALARRKPDEPHLVERAEAYAGGLELANGFGELTDAAEQRARLGADRELRQRRGLADYPPDEKFLGALEEGIPPSAGMALGFDRLVMLLTGARSIRDVLPFTWDEL